MPHQHHRGFLQIGRKFLGQGLNSSNLISLTAEQRFSHGDSQPGNFPALFYHPFPFFSRSQMQGLDGYFGKTGRFQVLQYLGQAF